MVNPGCKSFRCRGCDFHIEEDHIKKKKFTGGFIAKCPECDLLNNIKCRHCDGQIKSVTIFSERRQNSRQREVFVS